MVKKMDIFASANYAKLKQSKVGGINSNLFAYSKSLELADKCIAKFQATGSRYICNPPVTNTDEDYIVLINGSDAVQYLKSLGFVPSINDDYNNMSKDRFVSFRRGDINLIVTSSAWFYNNFVKATELAKEFNLTDKKHRIMLFEALLFEALRAGKPKRAP
jgi:hypothetical protein